MNRTSKIAASALLVFCAAMILSPRMTSMAGAQTAQQNAIAVVKPAAFVSLDKVPRGKEFQAAVVVQIAQGLVRNCAHDFQTIGEQAADVLRSFPPVVAPAGGIPEGPGTGQ